MSVLDYSRGRPTAVQLRANGYGCVMRYIGTPGNLKNVTVAEYADLTSGSGGKVSPVGVGLVYEAGTGDALGGFAAGVLAAKLARADADHVGHPRGRPIYFTVDRDLVSAADFNAAMEFLRGAGSVLGGAQFVGIYGEYDVIQRARQAGVARWFWQTVAWSGGKRDPNAHLYQRLGQVTVVGVSCDLSDQLQADYGQHPAPQGDDPLSALTDQEQRDLYNRIMGFCSQKWFVPDPNTGEPVEVSADHPGAKPAVALNTLDGHYIITQIGAGIAQTAALATAVQGVQAGTLDVQAVADQLKTTLGAEVAADLAARLAS